MLPDATTTMYVVAWGGLMMRNCGSVGRRFGILVALSAGLALGMPGQAWAAKPITVCPSGCDFTDLQDAINAASPRGKISIGPGTYQRTQSSDGAPGFTIAKRLTLVGAGADKTTLSDGFGQVVQINAGAVVAIRGVTIDNDFVDSDISNGGYLLLSDSTVTHAGHRSIINDGTLVLRNATITQNFSTGGDAGLDNHGVAILTNTVVSSNAAFIAGGGIANGGYLLVNQSTIENNVADTCDSQDVGGGILNGGTALINDSTISGNSAPTGGGIFTTGSMTLRDSTVTNNTAEDACGDIPPPLGGGILFGGKLTLLDTTVNCNSAVVANESATTDDIDNFNGTGTLRQFGSTIGGCPAMATPAASDTAHARRSALFRLDRALWAAALRPSAQNVHESRALRSAIRAHTRLIRQAAQRIQRLLTVGTTR